MYRVRVRVYTTLVGGNSIEMLIEIDDQNEVILLLGKLRDVEIDCVDSSGDSLLWIT